MSLPVIPPPQWLFGSNEDGEGGEGKKVLLMIIQFFHWCVIIGYNIETSCQNKGEVVAGQEGDGNGAVWLKTSTAAVVAGNVLLEAWYGAGGGMQPFSGPHQAAPLATVCLSGLRVCPSLEGCVALQAQAGLGLLAEFLSIAKRMEAQLSACTPQCGVLEAEKGKIGDGCGMWTLQREKLETAEISTRPNPELLIRKHHTAAQSGREGVTHTDFCTKFRAIVKWILHSNEKLVNKGLVVIAWAAALILRNEFSVILKKYNTKQAANNNKEPFLKLGRRPHWV